MHQTTNYIPPHLLNIQPKTKPIPATSSSSSSHHFIIQSLILENQHLSQQCAKKLNQLALAQEELRQLTADAENEGAAARKVHARWVEMESEAKAVEEMKGKLEEKLGDVEKMKKEVVEMMRKCWDEMPDMEMEEELRKVVDVKGEIQRLRKELRRGRAAVEHEKRVHACNIEVSKAMEKCKTDLAKKIRKLRVEGVHAAKRARAAAAVEGALYLGNGYGNSPDGAPCHGCGKPRNMMLKS